MVDFAEYIDLELLDRDPENVFDNALANLQSYFPEWVPREGNTEVLLLESMALEVAEAIYAINRLPSAVTEILLSMLDIERFQGEPPTADIRFELSISTGTTIPAGVTLVLETQPEEDPLIFTTDSELVIEAGETSGIVSATADRYTSDGNGIAAETTVEVQDSLTYVNFAKLNSVVTGGIDPEDDLEYLTRGVQRLQRLTTTLLLPSHFSLAALEFPFVKRAIALDMYNSAADLDNNGPVGSDPGYIAVAVYGDGENVSTEDKATLQAYFDLYSMANLVVTIINPTLTPVNVTATIAIEAGALASEVIAAVETELEEYFDPATWNWSGTVRKNDIISIITNTPGVDFVNTITIPASDVTLSGVAALATPGVINISVV